MDEFSQSEPLQFEMEGTEIVEEKEGLQQKFSPRKLEQEKATVKKVETDGGLKVEQQKKQKYEMYRPQLVESLKYIFKEEQDCERLRRELLRALRDEEYDPKIEKIRSLVKALRGVSSRDRDNGRYRREMIEALQDPLPSDQGNKRSIQKMVVVPKDVPQHDKEGKWLRREISEDMQSELFCDQDSEKLKSEIVEVESITRQDPESAQVESSTAAVQEVVSSEAMKDLSVCEEEYEKNKMPKMATNENFRDLDLQGFKFFTWKEPNPAKIKSSATASAFQKVIFPEAMKELSPFEKLNEIPEIFIHERFVQDVQLQEFKSFTWQESKSSPVKSSATAAVCKDVPEKWVSQNVNKAGQCNTSIQSKTPSELQIEATGNESSKRAVDCEDESKGDDTK